MTAPRRAVVAWQTYDLANTIFSFSIITLYFPGWVKETMGGTDAHLGVALGVSNLVVAIAAPMAGAASDRLARRIPLLVASTLACVTATALIGVDGLGPALLLFGAANLFFQLGLVFYDAMLPAVSTAANVGAVGGTGIGIGYVGSFIGLGAGAYILRGGTGREPLVFVATAALFLAFAIPCFVLVKEPRTPRSSPRPPARGHLRRTLRDVWTHRPLRTFLAARFLYTDVANTMIAFMVPYAIDTGGFTTAGAQPIAGVAIAAAIVGGFAAGFAVDRLGPKRVLTAVLVLWGVTLGGAALIPALGLPRGAFWAVAGLAGLSLGGTWASDRPLMLRLTPPGRVGEFYGVYGMVGRFAAVFGPLLWALVAVRLGWGQPAAVATLLLVMLVALGVLARVRPGGGGPSG